ncbi:uncharacterized protein LOC21391888 [Morus notabilis]|uniref:uncharacterized protein LOC21391888 n=1 Tax=Morus notabilis TaxID=981085 RepID=UPI000CED327F|nr:uncharacterized protein LOC21391888 [Morus notabilis]
MSCYMSLPFSLLLPLLLFLSQASSLSFSDGNSHFPHAPQTSLTPSSEWELSEKQHDYLWGTKMSFVEGPDFQPVQYYSLVLAAERTQRKDPLNGFKRYIGGWNISERHYWASVGFTAVPLFAIAAIWFVAFGLCLSLICLCHFCCGRRSYGYSGTAYTLSLICLILFSIAAVAGCIVLYAGQDKFHHSTTNTLDYVVSQADFTVGELRNVSDYLSQAKQLGVDQIFLPANVQTDIDQIQIKINSSASNVADKTAENADDMRDLLDSVRLALIIVAAIMLVLIFLGLLFSLFGMQILVYILVITGWIIVAGTFILCGTFLILHTVAGDTCVAMDQWVLNPTAHTALDEIMPCVDKTMAQETVLRSKEVTLQIVELINEVITNVSNINFAPQFVPFYFNQSGPLVPILCNPYHHDLTDRVCTAGEVDMNNATQVWEKYVCQVAANGVCTTTGRLTPNFYSQMSSGVSMSIALHSYGPFLVELQDCTFARETFSQIYSQHCPALQRYSKWIYVGLLMVSTAVMMSLIFWVIYSRERRHRIYTRQSMADDHHSEPEKD